MFFGVYNTTNDSGSDTCSEKAEKSSHETDEAASSQEESAHIAAQNIESESNQKIKVKSETTTLKKSSSDNQLETGNTDSTNNSTKEIDINMKKL